MKPHTKGLLLIILGTCLWGSSGVLSQHLFKDKLFTAEWLVTIRLIASGALLLAADALTHKGDIFSIWKTSDRWQLIIFGVLGMLGVQYTFFAAIVHSNAATATILQYLMPVFMVLYMVIATRRPPQPRELLTVAMAMAGTFILVTKCRLDTLAISPQAVFWGLMSAVFAAFYTLQPRTIIKKWRSTLVVGWGMLIGGLLVCIYQPVWQFTGIMDVNAAASLAGIICFGTALAFFAYLESTKYLTPAEIGVFASLEPLSSIVLSIIFFNINFGLTDFIGAAIIITAATSLSLKKQKTDTT